MAVVVLSIDATYSHCNPEAQDEGTAGRESAVAGRNLDSMHSQHQRAINTFSEHEYAYIRKPVSSPTAFVPCAFDYESFVIQSIREAGRPQVAPVSTLRFLEYLSLDIA